MYSIIGKQVFNDSVIKLRVLDLETSKYEDVSIKDMKKYEGQEITNGEYNENSPFGVYLYYQSIYSLPIFYKTGGTNTYLYKVIISMSDTVTRVGNITGCVKSIYLENNFLRLFQLDIHDMIVATPSGLVGFHYNLNGEVTSFDVSAKYVTRVFKEQFSYSGMSSILSTCFYKNIPCFYFAGDMYLNRNSNRYTYMLVGAVSGLNKYQLLSLNKTSYSKKSYYVNSDEGKSILLERSSDILHKYVLEPYTSSLCLGIDGFTFIGKQFDDVKNESLEEVKERLLLTQPSIANKMEKGLSITDSNEVLHLNMFDFSIPDYVTSVHQFSLYFEYSEIDIERANQYKIREVYIPENVKYFSNEAFVQNYISTILQQKLGKITCIVENSNIFDNVVLSSYMSKIGFKSIETDGRVIVDLNKLKSYADSRLFKSLKTQTWNMKVIKGTTNAQTELLVKNDIDLCNNYAILPSESFLKNGMKKDSYVLFEFEDTSEFLSSLESVYNKLSNNFMVLKQKVDDIDLSLLTDKTFNNYSGMISNHTSTVSGYIKLVESFKVKHGDVNKFNTIVSNLKTLLSDSAILRKKIFSHAHVIKR